MKTEEFDYFLPKELIAQQPEEDRSAARLLVLERPSGRMSHRRFSDVTDYLHEGDLLVLNDTRVIPARLAGRKTTGGHVDILLTEEIDDRRWSCLVTGLRRGKEETTVWVGDNAVRLTSGERSWTLETTNGTDVRGLMTAHGVMPLPHYIKREKADRNPEDYEHYQTVYAKHEGSIAAPTAGLHFDDALLGRLRGMGVNIAFVTLHIGIGTFFLIKSEDVEGHEMHGERYSVPASTLEAVRQTKEKGKRVIAVGTSAVRTLETAFANEDGGRPEGCASLFIYPGYRYRIVDALVTNFHLPRSTPLLLVCAFAGKEAIHSAYKEAVEHRYRFYSYGDAMLIS